MIASDRPLSVSALSQRISGQLADLGTVLVQGELSQAKVHGSGHFYATLRDSEAVVSLVMWRSTVVRNGPLPAEGSQVVVRGTITVYPPRGQYQITATRITPAGAGDLAARLEALKARLVAEGLFAEERKRPLPLLPRAVGLATAAGSAAFADLVHSIHARFPDMPIVHAPCQVQGAGAPGAIVAALRALARHGEVDVIICGRGGGSAEDLAAFNDEAVVRAIAACPLPVIAAIGHETDSTLADFAADVCAKTPTAAGELVVPVAAELRQRLDDHAADLDAAIDQRLAEQRERLAALATHRALANPAFQINLRRQRLDDLAGRLDESTDRSVRDHRQHLSVARLRLLRVDPIALVTVLRERWRRSETALARATRLRLTVVGDRLAAAAGRLDALSPLAVIARGYAVLRLVDGTVVRRVAQAPVGTVVEAQVRDGRVRARVE